MRIMAGQKEEDSAQMCLSYWFYLRNDPSSIQSFRSFILGRGVTLRASSYQVRHIKDSKTRRDLSPMVSFLL